MERYHCKAVLPSDTDKMSCMAGVIFTLAEAAKFTDKETFRIRLAAEEALINAVKHGNKQDVDKKVLVDCQIDIDDGTFILTVEDEGGGFDPATVADPTLDENLSKPNGRGLLLMREFMSEVRYNDVGNKVTLKMNRFVCA